MSLKQKEIKCSLKLNLLFGIKQNKLSRNLNETGAQNIDYNPNLLLFWTNKPVYLPKEAKMDRIRLACTQTLFYFSFRSFQKHRRARQRNECARTSAKYIYQPTPAPSSNQGWNRAKAKTRYFPLPSLIWRDRSLLFHLILSKIVGYAVAGHYHVQSETIFKL